MRRVMSGVAVVMLALGAASMDAQSRPSFSGNWVLVESTPVGTAALGTDLMISQDARTIQINLIGIGFRGGSADPSGTEMRYPVRITYFLDGAEHPTSLISEPPLPSPPPPRAGVVSWTKEESISKATWGGADLVIMQYNKHRTTAPSRTPAVFITRQTVRQALSLSSEGILIVDSLIVADPSPRAQVSKVPVPVRSIYKRN